MASTWAFTGSRVCVATAHVGRRARFLIDRNGGYVAVCIQDAVIRGLIRGLVVDRNGGFWWTRGSSVHTPRPV
jgi:lipid-binding SYLF domain-containing protein